MTDDYFYSRCCFLYSLTMEYSTCVLATSTTISTRLNFQKKINPIGTTKSYYYFLFSLSLLHCLMFENPVLTTFDSIIMTIIVCNHHDNPIVMLVMMMTTTNFHFILFSHSDDIVERKEREKIIQPFQ